MLRNKIIGIIVLLIITASSAILITGCYQDDGDTRVTIHLERNDLAFKKEVKEKRLIDRVLEFFSTSAYAGGWSDFRYGLSLTISSSTFSDLSFSLPDGATEFTTTIPSGNNISFLIIAEYDNGINGLQKFWGGQTIVNLLPGDQSVSIPMIPMTWGGATGATGQINISWQSTSPYGTSYNLYRSSSIDGPYSLLVNTTSTFYQNTGLGSGKTFYYKINVLSSNGEGVAYGPVSATSF